MTGQVNIPPWQSPHRRCGVHFLTDDGVRECLLPRVHDGEHRADPTTEPPDHRLLVSISPGWPRPRRQRSTVPAVRPGGCSSSTTGASPSPARTRGATDHE